MDDVVRGVVGEILDSDMIAEAVDLALEQLRSGRSHQLERRAQIECELSVCDERLSRLVEALVRGGTMETVVNQIKAEEARKKLLVSELDNLSAARENVPGVDGAAIAGELKDAAGDVRALLAGATAQARQMLRKILDGKRAPGRHLPLLRSSIARQKSSRCA